MTVCKKNSETMAERTEYLCIWEQIPWPQILGSYDGEDDDVGLLGSDRVHL